MDPAADGVGIGPCERLGQHGEPPRADVNIIVHKRKMRALGTRHAAVACVVEALLRFLGVPDLDG